MYLQLSTGARRIKSFLIIEQYILEVGTTIFTKQSTDVFFYLSE